MASEQDNAVWMAAFGGRLRRYARVTTTMGGLAARVAGERYLGWDIDRAKHAADLRQALGGLKGPIMKVAQILSTIPDALPAEYADELAGLQADAPAMGWLFTKRRMASELGADWQQKLTSLNVKPFRRHLLDRCIKLRARR